MLAERLLIDRNHTDLATVKAVAAAPHASSWQREPVRFKREPPVDLPVRTNVAAMSQGVNHEARCVPG